MPWYMVLQASSVGCVLMFYRSLVFDDTAVLAAAGACEVCGLWDCVREGKSRLTVIRWH